MISESSLLLMSTDTEMFPASELLWVPGSSSVMAGGHSAMIADCSSYYADCIIVANRKGTINYFFRVGESGEREKGI